MAQQILAQYEGRANPCEPNFTHGVKPTDSSTASMILQEIANKRAAIAACEANISAHTRRFAFYMASIYAHLPPTSATGASTIPSFINLTGSTFFVPEANKEAKVRLLEDHVSRIQSELLELKSTFALATDVSKENARSKRDIQDIKDGIRKETETRTKEVESMRNAIVATESEIGVLKTCAGGGTTEAARDDGTDGSNPEISELRAQMDILQASVERVEQELAGVQKGHDNALAKQQAKELETGLGGFGTTAGKTRDEEQQLPKALKRSHEVIAALGSPVDVEEERLTKRVRLSLVPANTKQDEASSHELMQATGGPPSKQLKELICRLQDQVATLEGEIGENHTEMSEQVRELQEYVGFEPMVYSGGAESRPAGRSEGMLPAASSSRPIPAGVCLFAPSTGYLGNTSDAQPAPQTMTKDDASPHQTETLATLRRDVDKIMEVLLISNPVKSTQSDGVAKNMVASENISSTQPMREVAKVSVNFTIKDLKQTVKVMHSRHGWIRRLERKLQRRRKQGQELKAEASIQTSRHKRHALAE